MFLEDFSTKETKIDFTEYIEKIRYCPEKARKYCFLKQGDEPDRTVLTNEIYAEIFPWFDERLHSGDTLNTYRTAIFQKFYDNAYSNLNRNIQIEILKIIERYTETDEEFLFEFDAIGKNGTTYKQLCNNYQIGNFGIFPKGNENGGINMNRAQQPYNDFFDQLLTVVGKYYNGWLDEPTSDLEKSVILNGEYFDQFDDFTDFVYSNYLEDFFNEEGEIIKLSQIADFEEYIKTVNEIIKTRGKRIINVLITKHKILDDVKTKEKINTEEINEMNHKNEQKKAHHSSYRQEETSPYKSEKEIAIEYLHQVKNILIPIEEINNRYLNYDSVEMQRIYKITQKNCIPLKKSMSFLLGIMFISVFLMAYGGRTWGNLFSFVFLIAFLAMPAIVIYNLYISLQRIKARKRIEVEDSILRKEQEKELQAYYQSEKYRKYSIEFPSEFFNLNYIARLIQLLTTGRADSLTESFNVLERQLHRERLEDNAENQLKAQLQHQKIMEEMELNQLREQENIRREQKSYQEKATKREEKYYEEMMRHNDWMKEKERAKYR